MEKLVNELNETLSKMNILLRSLDEEKINEVPFLGSWTAGQLAEHIVLSNGGFDEMINGPIDETNRPADKDVAEIKNIFLNFNTKMSAPESICPPFRPYIKDDLLHQLDGIKANMVCSVKELDLTKTCTSFELPYFGFLTRLEAVYFVMYHTQRHNHQLENMLKFLN